MATIILTGNGLSLEDVLAVANGAEVTVSKEATEKATLSRRALEKLITKGEPVYGVTTGFGALKSERIPEQEREALQRNLIRSHAVGVGEPLGIRETRSLMIITAGSLLRGYSGVGPEPAELIVQCLNKKIHPLIPSQGSLGASGDLAPLAHLAMALIGEGKILHDNRPSAEVLRSHGLEPLSLQPKVGLALINGTHAHTGLACLVAEEAKLMMKVADVACAMMVDAMLCSAQPFRPQVQWLRPHPHQVHSAANVSRLLEESELLASHAECGEVQDAYSIRCAPQVHGAARQTLHHLLEVLEVELESVTDNPLVFSDEVISAGNFHGEPVGLALDYLKMGLAELASISERRIERALNPAHNRGLPAFLAVKPGVQSGLMLCQYTAASLVSENKVLAHPSCVDSITTGAGQEDHVSMAMNAALHAQRVLRNTRNVLAIELITAAQALDIRRQIQPHKPGIGVRTAWESIRKQVKSVTEDRSLSDEIERFDLQAVVEEVQKVVGKLA
ncbi:MAG: histidine ammonia-lyase [Candidatus Caldarchaeum sp.]